jgi:hypothetical protein
MADQLLSAKPNPGLVLSGIYNANPPAPADGQGVPLQQDSNGNLLVNVAVGSTTNPSVGSTGSTAPTSATEIGSIDAGGKLQGASVSNPVPVAVISGGGANASVGTTGATAPTSATEIGAVDRTGKLQNVTSDARGAANALAVEILDASGNQITSFGSSTVTANQGSANATPWNDNVAQWGGTAVAAAATSSPAGTEAAPILRDIPRKYGAVLSTTNLSASTVYYYPGEVTSPTSANWFDSAKTGATFVSITNYVAAEAFSGANGLAVETADDPNDTTVGSGTCSQVNSLQGIGLSLVAGTPLTGVFPVVKRYYRIKYSVGATQPSTFKLSYSEFQGSPYAAQFQNNNGFGTQANVGASSQTYSGYSSSVGFNTEAYIDVAGNARTALKSVTSAYWNGASFDQVRTPNIFKTAQATSSGNTALWTPTSGKKFRLMRFMVQVTGNALTSGGAVITVSFQDSTTAMNIAMDVFVPGSTAFSNGDDFVSPWVDLGNGFLSAAANNVLNVNLSAALSPGNVRVTCCGTEE